MVNRLYLSLKRVGQEHTAEQDLLSTSTFDHRRHGSDQKLELRIMLSTDITSKIRFVLSCYFFFVRDPLILLS